MIFKFVQITYGRHAWSPAIFYFAKISALYVFAQVEDKLVCHSTFHIEQKYIIFWLVFSVYGLYRFEPALLQEPLYLCAVDWISGKSVYLPAEYPACFSRFYLFHHLIKDWPIVWLLGCLCFGVDVFDSDTQRFGELFQSSHLVVNGLHLSILAFRGFSRIEEVGISFIVIVIHIFIQKGTALLTQLVCQEDIFVGRTAPFWQQIKNLLGRVRIG